MRARVLLLGLFLFITGAVVAEPVWQTVQWRGEDARASKQGGVCAVVSLARARLIYLGAADGSLNLLDAPVPAVAPTNASDSPDWGGHRFWLGPQKRWVWPAPVEWEHAAAAEVDEHDGVLTVVHQRKDPAYPTLTREYAWDGARLRCTVRWRADGRPYFGMHVIPVNTPFVVTARRVVWEEVPEGIVDVQMTGPVTRGLLKHPAIAAKDDTVVVTAGRKMAKVGFVVQTLAVERPQGWRLAVHPGPHTGLELESPDKGYLSQVWVGGSDVPLAELEQLTPYLLGDAAGNSSSTIFLEATPPAR
jgi:hypothetical protein